MTRYYTILYYTILYYTILYYTILYYTILYHTLLYDTTLYYTIVYYTTLYYTKLYYTRLYYTILYYTILYYTILYTMLYYILCYTSPSTSAFSEAPEGLAARSVGGCLIKTDSIAKTSEIGDTTQLDGSCFGLLLCGILVFGSVLRAPHCWKLPNKDVYAKGNSDHATVGPLGLAAQLIGGQPENTGSDASEAKHRVSGLRILLQHVGPSHVVLALQETQLEESFQEKPSYGHRH